MKKIFSFAVVLAAVAMVSCAGNATKPAATEAEAAAVEAPACCEECEKADSCTKEPACEECEKACEKACEKTEACCEECEKTAEVAE